MAQASIVVCDLVKRFGDVTAIDGISFKVQPGTIFGFLGRNGAGKTTTLEFAIGLRRATSGSIRMLGLDPWKSGDFKRLRPRFGAQLQATSLPEKARVGLEGKEERLVSALSGGEQQRLALALALQHDPEIVLLDEPTAGMDAYGRRVLWGDHALHRRGGALVQ